MIRLRFENDHVFTTNPPDQAWFSDPDTDTQLYIAHSAWVEMGRPDIIDVELRVGREVAA